MLPVISKLITLSLAFMSVADSLPRTEQPPVTIALAPILNTSNPNFANADKESVRIGAAQGAWELLHEAIRNLKYESPGLEAIQETIKGLEVDFSKAEDRNKETLAKIGTKTAANFVIFAQITDVDQKNLDVSAVLNNLSGPASSTKVKVKVWLLDVPGNKLLIDGKSFEAEAKGPRFGTTKKGELSGNPTDVAYSIMEENKKRAKWTSRAARSAIAKACSGFLGNLDPVGK